MNIQRVLFVSGAANLGGVQSSTRARIRALERAGVSAHKLFLQPGAGMATYADIPTFITGEPREQDQIVRAGRYDAISMINRLDLLPSLRRTRYRGRVLLEVRGKARHAIDACKTLTSRDVGGIIVISRYVRDIVRKALSTNDVPIHVVYNTVDTGLFRPLGPSDEKVGLYGHDAAKRPVVLWVGRLSKNKNYKEMLRIAALLVRNMPRPPVFWVVSDTNAKDNTKKFWHMVRAGGLGRHVRLLPCVPHAMMVHVYNAVARSGGCVLSSSKSEGFQNSLLEAMACGVPVVSSAVGGNVELVDDGVNGRLYPLGQPIVAARSIRQILNNTMLWRQYAAAGLDRVRLRHAPSLHARTLMHVLESTPVMTYGPVQKPASTSAKPPAAAAAKSAAAQAKTAATPGKRTVKKTAKKLVAKSGSKPLTKASTPKKKFKSATTAKSARVVRGAAAPKVRKPTKWTAIRPGVRR